MAGAPVIPRPRLLDPCRDARAVVVAGPSGYGKTVLAEQLAETWAMPVVRVNLVDATTAGDLVDRTRRAMRRAGWSDIAASMSAADTPPEAFDALVDLAAASGVDLGVFLDDAHRLTADGLALLADVVDALPETWRVVIATRTPLDVAGAVVIAGDDLRLTPGEVRAVLEVAAVAEGGEIADDVVDDVTRVTAGWVAAVVVAASAIRDDPSWSLSRRSAGLSVLGGLLAGLLDEHGPPLARLAALPLIDEASAAIVAGPGAAAVFVESGIPHRRDGRWMWMPDSVRDALAGLAPTGDGAVGGEFAAGGARPLVVLDAEPAAAVAAHYAAAGELGAAVRLLFEQGHVASLAELLAGAHWSDLEGLGLARVGHVIDLLEHADREGRPMPDAGAVVAVWVRALWAAEPNHPLEARALFDRLEAFVERADRSGREVAPAARRAVAAERVRMLSRSMQPAEAIEAAADLLERIPMDEAATRGRVLMASAHAHAVVGAEDANATAAALFEQAAGVFETLREPRWQAEALARLGYSVHHHGGRPHAAAAAMERALALLPSSDRTRAQWLSSYADVLDTVGAEVEAWAATTEAIAIGERLRDPAVVGLAWWSRGWIAGRRGDVAALRGVLDTVEAAQPSWLQAHSGVEFYGSMADFFVSLDDAASMQRCVERATAIHEAVGYQEAVDMMRARIEAHVGDPATALALLDELDAAVGAQPNTRWVRRLEAALAWRRLGDVDRAAGLVDEAMRLTAAMGVPDLPMRFEGRLVRRIAEYDGAAPSAGAASGAVAGAVVTMLGTFAIRSGARDVTPAAGHPSTLVKVLALRGPTTVDEVIDVLWPDADASTGRARLRNTLNRVRSQSGPIVERSGGMLALVPGVSVDVDAFEEAVASAVAAAPEVRVGLARRALGLYAGELLPGDRYEDWAAAPRERLARQFLGLVDVVADAAEADGELDEAVRWCEVALAADPLDEQRYVRLAQLLAAQGRVSAARQVAQRGVAMLDELGVAAGDELADLAA